jgi:hypothetical protein
MRRGHEGDPLAADAAHDPAEHNHSVSSDNTPDLASLTDNNLRAGHIAFKLAIDLDFALANNRHALARKLQVIFDYHSALIRHDDYPSSWGTNIIARYKS